MKRITIATIVAIVFYGALMYVQPILESTSQPAIAQNERITDVRISFK